MSDAYLPLRWGILGAGAIAHSFCADTARLPDHRLVAVGSREKTRADAFADKYGIPRRHTRYEDLAADPEVDIVYVATPHSFHKEHSVLCLHAGKAVLCEKPLTVCAAEAEEILRAAREREVFFMEGMWARFFPLWATIRGLLADGAIGKPRMLVADFGFRGGATGDDGKLAGVNPQARLFNPALGGGALLDVGVYPVSLAEMLFGAPDAVAAVGTFGHTGVDENTGMLLHYPGGEVAVAATSLQISTMQSATVLGTDGKIEVPAPWWAPQKAILTRNGREPQTLEAPHEGKGFQFEAIEAARCLRAGLKESPILSLDSSLTVMRSLDAIRAQLGLRYPME